MLEMQISECTSPTSSGGRQRWVRGCVEWGNGYRVIQSTACQRWCYSHPSLTDEKLVPRAEKCLLNKQFDWFALTFWASNQRCRDKNYSLAFQREKENNNSNNNNIIVKIHWACTKCQVLAGHFPDFISSHAHSKPKWQAWFYLLWQKLRSRTHRSAPSMLHVMGHLRVQVWVRISGSSWE